MKLWHKISTTEDPGWTRRYHEPDPDRRSFGAKVVIRFEDGKELADEIRVANAHPAGEQPFKRPDYVRKFETLTEGIIDVAESRRFIELVQALPKLDAAAVNSLNVQVAADRLEDKKRDQRGIF